jgi:hypothetical protein
VFDGYLHANINMSQHNGMDAMKGICNHTKFTDINVAVV